MNGFDGQDSPDSGRRAFLQGLGAAALIGAGAPAVAAETPKRGGTLRLALAGASLGDTLEIGAAADTVMIVAGLALYNGLVERGEDGRPRPDLASSWEPRNGARDWVLNLRKGVLFSNGKEFVADDAIYSLNLHRGASASVARSALASVTDIVKLDPHQIQVSLTQGDADFPSTLTDPRFLMAPDGFRRWAKPVGTGAFRLESFEPGLRVALKRAPDFWKDGRGFLDGAEISVVSDAAARLEALKTNQTDVINRVDPRAAAALDKTAGLKLVRATSGWRMTAAMACDRAPFDNPDLRLAVKLMADREQMLKAIFAGYASRGNDQPVPPGDPLYNPDLGQRRRDPERVAFLLRRAGAAPPLTLDMASGLFDGAADFAQTLQTNAAASGVRLEVRKDPLEGFWRNVWMRAPFVEGYGIARASACQTLGDAFGAKSPLNETRWSHDKFERLLAEARVETDEAKRKPLVWEMQRLVHEDGGALIPLFRDWLDARQDRVAGVNPTGGYELANGYILEKAWLRS